MIMASHLEVETEKVDEKMQKADPSIDQMARHVQVLFKFKNFYDQMAFSPYHTYHF